MKRVGKTLFLDWGFSYYESEKLIVSLASLIFKNYLSMKETYSYDELIDMYYGNTEAVASKKEILEKIKGDHRIDSDDYEKFTKTFWSIGIDNTVYYTPVSIDKLKAFIENSKPIIGKKTPKKRLLTFCFFS